MNLLVRPRACVFRATPRLASAPLVGRRASSYSITNSWSTRPRPALLRPSCQSLSSSAAPVHNSNTDDDDDDNDDSNTPLEDRYLQLVRDQHVHADVTQRQAMGELARLWRDLERVDPGANPPVVATPQTTSTFGSWFGQASTAASPTASNITSVPRGVYLHGGVGCGKTFLMHLFYETLTAGPWAAEKQTIHFHQFMLTVHQEMHKARQTAAGQSDAILPAVIRQTAARGRLICLDEFQVTDVADAYGTLGAWLRRGGHVESAAGGPVSEWSPARPLCALY
jgi:hypothetical protein